MAAPIHHNQTTLFIKTNDDPPHWQNLDVKHITIHTPERYALASYFVPKVEPMVLDVVLNSTFFLTDYNNSCLETPARLRVQYEDGSIFEATQASVKAINLYDGVVTISCNKFDMYNDEPIENKSEAEQPFLRALLDNPHDIATHLVYSDWLEENGRLQEAQTQRQVAKDLTDARSLSATIK